MQLGAARAVGVDISDAAIAEARQLSLDAGIAASFVRADVLSWLEDYEEEKFDVIFVSYGWLAWLGDLSRWARGVASVLKPGGRLVLIEFHPLAWSLGEGGTLTGDAYFEDAPGKKCDDPGGVSDYVRSSGDGLIPDGMELGRGRGCLHQPAAVDRVPAHGRRSHQRAGRCEHVCEQHAGVPVQQWMPTGTWDETDGRPPLYHARRHSVHPFDALCRCCAPLTGETHRRGGRGARRAERGGKCLSTLVYVTV